MVVDASVIFAALLKDGSSRAAFLQTSARLVAPPFLLEEVRQLLPRIADIGGTDERIVADVSEGLLRRVRIVPPAEYAAFRPAAVEACSKADAEDDDEYVAVALALHAPIWAYDKDYRRIEGIRVVTTAGHLEW